MTTWMIVEDEPDIYEVLLAMCEMWGIDGIGFVDGEEAAAWIEDVDTGRYAGELPELAMLDIRLPGRITGPEVGERLRKSPQLRNMGIIHQTAYRLSPDEEQRVMKQSGADKLMYKPLPKFNELQQVLESVVASRRAPHVTTLAKPRILVVEDDLHLRQGIIDILELSDYIVSAASDGEAALKILEVSSPDIIVSDIMMPRMDGISMLQSIRLMPRYNHIPVIFLTAKADKHDMQLGKRLGAEDYLTKPYSADELLASVRTRLEQQAKLASSFLPPVLLGKLLLLSSIDENLRSLLLQQGISTYALVEINDYETIAITSPYLVIVQNAHTSQITTLRDFALSENLPIVLIYEELPPFDDQLELVDAGADEITNLESVAEAVKMAAAQYAHPSLIQTKAAWRVLIAGENFNLRTDAAEVIERAYHVQISDADTYDLCLKLAADESPELIIIDEDLDVLSLATELKEQGSSAPIMVLGKEARFLYSVEYALNIRGVVPYDQIKVGLVPLLERLLRWRKAGRRPLDIWADYHVLAAEAEFQLNLRSQSPVVAATFEETGKLFSGLIHDLRNALFSLSTGLEEYPEINWDQLRVYGNAASLLLETIAEARLKGAWMPNMMNSSELSRHIIEAIEQTQLIRSDVSINVNDVASAIPNSIYTDQRQIRQLIANILLTMACDNDHITIASESGSLTFAGQGKGTISFDLAVHVETRPLTHWVTAKLANRLRIKIVPTTMGCRLSFPHAESLEEGKIRLEIAQNAGKTERIRNSLTNREPLAVSPALASLIAPIAAQLVHLLQRIVELTGKVAEEAPQTDTTARYALLLSRNLLITSAGYKFSRHAVSLKPILDTLLQLRRDYLKTCTVDFSVAPGTPDAYADELALLQILVNLLTNAVEAMSGKGRLSIRAASHEQGVEIRVSDNGPGIPLEQQGQIFDLFYTTKRGQERGVGLHIVQSIMNELGGQITLDSSKRGTTFTLIIPAAEHHE